MGSYAALALAIPLLGAAVLAGFGQFVRSRLIDAVGIAIAAADTGLCAVLLHASAGHTVRYDFGGWQAVHGVPIGIVFAVGPFGAGLALLAAGLVTVTFIFSWRFFKVGALFQVLVLVFLAAMIGFAFTGDLFNLFVFFELMSVTAFALTAYRSDQTAPLQGAISFTVSNTVAAFLIMFGIALLYGRTDALNMAQIGQVLAEHGRPDGLVVTAFTLITCGFLVKAAVVPFHFWLADAYAVAPAPVCVLFSAVMSDLGLYAVARIYWTIFADPLQAVDGAIRGLLMALGTLTALLGAIMCCLQVHLKRMLAFATISHIGCFLIGIGLLTPAALAGTAVYLVCDGLLKGGLFLGAGVLIYALHSGDELTLHGRGRGRWLLGATFTLGGLGLAGLPPFGDWLGKALIEDSATRAGFGWVGAVLLIAEAATGGAVLRAAGRIFLGWGPRHDQLDADQDEREEDEEPQPRTRRNTLVLTVPAAVLVIGGLVVGLAPGLAAHATRAAIRFETGVAPSGGLAPVETSTLSLLLGVASVLGALLVAAAFLWRGRLPRVATTLGALVHPGVAALRRLHSGHVGDYIAWLVAGVAIFGAVIAVAVR